MVKSKKIVYYETYLSQTKKIFNILFDLRLYWSWCKRKI